MFWYWLLDIAWINPPNGSHEYSLGYNESTLDLIDHAGWVIWRKNNSILNVEKQVLFDI